MTRWWRGPITKRQLGALLMLGGIAGLLLPFLADLTGRAEYTGVGPTQRLILVAAGIVFLVGASLMPLGNRPA